ncbi:MAG: type II secretion system F family protein [Burkholderiales bacterium]|nr:type II secretion system F family protein [Burkholderiales bacterium]
MPTFAYTGRSNAQAVSGVLEGASAAVVADVLLGRGIVPVSITASNAGSGAPDVDGAAGPSLAHRFEQWSLPKVTVVDLMLLSRQLHTLLKSGVPILRALAGLQDSSTHVRLKQMLLAVRQSLESGVELSMSLAQHPKIFDTFYVALVRVGEMTGRMDEVFLRLFHHLEFEMFMGQQVKSALRYPLFVLAAMVAAIGVINVMVIPAFADVFKTLGAELPLATRILLGMSSFTIHYGWLVAIVAFGAAVGVHRYIATPEGKLVWDRLKLKVPLAGKIVRKAMLARMARSLSLSLKSGVPVEQALSVVAQTVENSHMARKVEQMRASVERGESILRAAVGSGVFTPVVLQMIAVGEETGALDELLEEIGELYTNEVQYELKTLAQQIEPIMIVFIGILVLTLALGVFLPIWDLGRVSLKK